MTKFSNGDVVRLKTGGDEMVVKKYEMDMTFLRHNKKLFPNDHSPRLPKKVECEWSNGEKAGAFDEDLLEFA